MPLSTGQVLNNRYRVESLLGQGGMGAVYRAWDTSLEIFVAVKENLDASPEAQKQFGREARILARLSHPNLPRVTDFFFVPGQGQYLVMDFVDGEDLGQMLARLGQLPAPEVLHWVGQVCDALAYLHSQSSPVIHRDIKPTNIKIRQDGRAMLVDFGIAKLYDPHLATTVGAKAVTPGYSPPEQYGGGITDARSDIYALGATLYHLLTGHKPPESVHRMVSDEPIAPLRQFNRQIPTEVEEAVLKAMDVSTKRRFQNARELRSALGGSAGSTAAPTIRTLEKTGRRLIPRVLRLGTFAIVSAIATIIIFSMLFRSRDEDVEPSPTALAAAPTSEAPAVATATSVPSTTSSPTAAPILTRTKQPTPTEIPRSSATTTPSPTVASPTPVATPTREPTPSATHLPAPTATVPGTATLFWDDFDTDRGHWSLGEFSFTSSDGTRELVDGALRITMVSRKNASQWATVPGITAADFRLTIDVTLLALSGDYASARFTFRQNDTTFYHIYFRDDSYRLQSVVNDNWTALIDWTGHSAIRLIPGVTNTFTIMVRRNSITLYANGTELTSVSDPSITDGGAITFGFSVPDANQVVTFAYDNLLIESVP
jgi:serine/threonine-protein kinase